MSDQSSNNQAKRNVLRLGYLYHYPQLGQDEPFQLDISIAAVPTEQHYDPETVELSVVAQDNDHCEHLVVEHPWQSREGYRVCAGVIRLVDRKGKVEEALTFGGQLAILPEAERTTLQITSPAPIMRITSTTPRDELLRDEIEILWAERRADWLAKPGEFERRLSSAEPFELYLATLAHLIEKLEAMPHKGQLRRELLYHLYTEIQRLQSASLVAEKYSVNDSDMIHKVLPKLDHLL